MQPRTTPRPLTSAFEMLYGPMVPAYEMLMGLLHDGQWWAWQRHAWKLATVDQDARLDVLEIGCGTGRMLATLAGEGHHVTGMDRSERMVRRASKRHDQVTSASVTEMPFQSESFDAVVGMFFPLRVLHNPAAWQEIARVLRPDGMFLYVHWAYMRGLLYPRLRKLAYGARYEQPLGDLPEIAARYVTVEQHVFADRKGHRVYYLVCRKEP